MILLLFDHCQKRGGGWVKAYFPVKPICFIERHLIYSWNIHEDFSYATLCNSCHPYSRKLQRTNEVVVVVTLFPTKIHENTHMYNTLTVVSPQNVRMYFVSGCQKKLRLIELAAATCYLQLCRATARTGPEEMTHWHPGGRFKESFSSNGFHNIYSIILSRIISRYVPFHQMSF